MILKIEKHRIHTQETIKTLSKASISRKPLFDKNITISQMNDDLMLTEIDRPGQIDVTH